MVCHIWSNWYYVIYAASRIACWVSNAGIHACKVCDTSCLWETRMKQLRGVSSMPSTVSQPKAKAMSYHKIWARLPLCMNMDLPSHRAVALWPCFYASSTFHSMFALCHNIFCICTQKDWHKRQKSVKRLWWARWRRIQVNLCRQSLLMDSGLWNLFHLVLEQQGGQAHQAATWWHRYRKHMCSIAPVIAQLPLPWNECSLSLGVTYISVSKHANKIKGTSRCHIVRNRRMRLLVSSSAHGNGSIGTTPSDAHFFFTAIRKQCSHVLQISL